MLGFLHRCKGGVMPVLACWGALGRVSGQLLDWCARLAGHLSPHILPCSHGLAWLHRSPVLHSPFHNRVFPASGIVPSYACLFHSPICLPALPALPALPCSGVSDHDLLFSKKEKEAPPAAAVTARSRPEGSRGGGSSSASWGGCGGPASGAGAGRGSSPRKGVFSKTATQGWSGGSELSDLFSKAVTISGPRGGAGSNAAVVAAARPPGVGWGGAGAGGAAAGTAGQPSCGTASGSPTQRRLSGSAAKDPLQ